MTNMHFTYDDNVELLSDTIPKDTIYLIFGDSFNQPVDMLPQSITNLKFGHSFNKPVDKLPQLLWIIDFGYSFNRSVDKLPQSITNLKFDYSFNQPLKMLPQSLEWLCLGYSFNQPVNHIPSSIPNLHFLNKCSLKIVNSFKGQHYLFFEDTEKYILTKEKCLKNENTPFSKKLINMDMIYREGQNLFYNIKKIPYGCIYDSIVAFV